jgi:hypothetical protein
MIRILLIALLAVTPAYAKSKNASTRVAEAFQLIPPQPRFRGIVIRLPPPYVANRPTYNANGKSLIYRECEVDIKQDPGEHTCRMVWAWI